NAPIGVRAAPTMKTSRLPMLSPPLRLPRSHYSLGTTSECCAPFRLTFGSATTLITLRPGALRPRTLHPARQAELVHRRAAVQRPFLHRADRPGPRMSHPEESRKVGHRRRGAPNGRAPAASAFRLDPLRTRP